MSKIVLASASPRRKELLEQAGISFCVMPATGEEIITKVIPSEVVENLSEQKANEVWEKISDERISAVLKKSKAVAKAARKSVAELNVRLMLLIITQLQPEDLQKLRANLTASRFSGTPV